MELERQLAQLERVPQFKAFREFVDLYLRRFVPDETLKGQELHEDIYFKSCQRLGIESIMRSFDLVIEQTRQL